jgi:hypothetical protein
MERRRALLPAVCVAAACVAMGTLPAAAEPRAVVELFTSQGCSSCPPADRLLGELARDPTLVAMSLPIDYWDYIGWKDTLAKPRHAARQRFYARTRGDGEVFTPQVVVNGLTYAVGSDKAAIEQAILKSRRNALTLSLPVKLAVDDGKVNVEVLAASGEGSAEVWLCALGTAVPVAIGRGENSGHTVTYHNVVRRWIKLGDWTGAARSFSVPTSDVEAADAVAVIVQSGSVDHPGTMLGAAMASLH